MCDSGQTEPERYPLRQVYEYLRTGALCIAVMLLTGCSRDDSLSALMDAIKKDDLAGVRASLANKPDLEPVCAGNEICKPLAYAAEFGDLEIIKLLMEAGADPNGKNGTDDIAFMAADDAFSFAGKSRAEIRAVQEYLLRGGTDPNQANSLGNTAFMCIAAAGDIEMMKIALGYGADVNHQNADGWTPLMAAAQFGQDRAALWLLKHGADKALKDKLGKTAHDYAVWFNHADTAKILKN